jgi:predicted dehydrogenase
VWNQEGGGCTLNHAVHHIDLLLWAKGLPSEVSSYMTNLGHPNSEEEDLSLSVLKFADGTVGQINASLLHHGENTKLDFQMERAGISIPHQTAASRSRENGFPIDDAAAKNAIDKAYAALPLRDHEHHEGQVEDFLNAVETGSQPAVDGREGRKTIELITGIYKSAILQEAVQFPIEPDDPHYSFPSRVKNAARFNRKTKNVRSFTDSTITDFKGKF